LSQIFKPEAASPPPPGFVEFLEGDDGVPVGPNAGDIIFVKSAVVAAGSTPIESTGNAGTHTITYNIQTSQAIASTDPTKIGLAAFNSADFTVDANGFVSFASTATVQTLTALTGTNPVPPNASDTIFIGTSLVAPRSAPISTLGIAGTSTVDIVMQLTTASASSIVNNVGLASFNSAQFSVDGNGYVSSTQLDLHITPFIVSAAGITNGASYTTIQAAVNAANTAGGGMVWIQPGTYTENLTLFSGIQLSGPSEQSVTIIGTHTPPSSGTLNLFRLAFQSATNIFSSAVAGTTAIIMEDCAVNVTNGYTFNLPNWTSSGSVSVFDIGNNGTNDGFFNNTGGASFFAFSAGIGNGTANSLTISGTAIFANQIVLGCPVNLVTGASLSSYGSSYQHTLTLSNNSTATFTGDDFSTGATPAITMSSSGNVKLAHVTINSSNNPAISGSGTGTLTYEDIVFLNNAALAGTLTTATVSWQPYSRAIASTDGTKVGTAAFNSAQFTVDANGFVSTSGTGIGNTITGQSGGALSPTAGNWNIFANGVSGSGTSTAGNMITSGSGSTLTVNSTEAQFMTNYTSVAFGASPYTALATDYYISCVSSGGAITIKLPNAPTTNRLFIIKDKSGNASVDNISITTVGGAVTIDGETTYTIAGNYGSITLLFNGVSYEIY
jgi:hypothetical protein